MIRATILVALAVLAACAACGKSDAPAPRTVVFVCEHGSAKSVAAAALFNEAAAERKLPWRAVSRGLEPDPVLAPAVVVGLSSDGLLPPAARPQPFTAADRDAARVVFLGEGGRDLGPNAEIWADIPAISVAYPAARDAIRARIATLLTDLPALR